jgi:hypothetical protein
MARLESEPAPIPRLRNAEYLPGAVQAPVHCLEAKVTEARNE